MSQFIPKDERSIVIEDTAELQLNGYSWGNPEQAQQLILRKV